MSNSINLCINEAGAQCILLVPLEAARTFLWRQKDRLELAAARISSVALKVIAHKDGLIDSEKNPDAVQELLRSVRNLSSLAGHNPYASLGAIQYQLEELNRAADKVQLQQEWIYGERI